MEAKEISLEGIKPISASIIYEIDSEKFVRANLFYNKEDGFYYPVIDPKGKSYISLSACVDLGNTVS